MQATLEEITKTALQLPAKHRIALAGFLLETEDSSSDPEIDVSWEQELQARIQAIDSGEVTGESYQSVMIEAEKQIRILDKEKKYYSIEVLFFSAFAVGVFTGFTGLWEGHLPVWPIFSGV